MSRVHSFRAIVVAAALLVAGAAGAQTLEARFEILKPGLSAKQATKRIGQAPVSAHSAGARDREFIFHRYHVARNGQPTLYLVVFENDRLVASGTVPELRQRADPGMNFALSAVLSQIAVPRRG